MISDERSVEGAQEMVIGERTLILEEACSYKAVRAAQYITEVLDKIDLAKLLGDLAESQQIGEQAAINLVSASDLKEQIDALNEKLDAGGVAEQDVAFIEADIQKKEALRVQMRADAMGDQQSETHYYALFAEALPQVFEQAPELVYNFCALMMIPNAKLEELYHPGQNRIKKEVEKQRKWLMFQTNNFEPLEIAAFYLPSLGLDTLKKAGGTLVETVVELMIPVTDDTEPETNPNGASSPDSLKSSNQNSELVETN